MKRIAIALLLVLIAATGALAQTTITEMQTGLVADHTLVQVLNVTVVAERYNGVWVSEAPHGAYNGIWVYTDGHTVTVGDVVNIEGEYYEYYDLSELDTTAGTIVAVGTAAVPAPSVVPAAVLVADYEAYESCAITVPDAMVVTVAPSTYGEWFSSFGGAEDLMFDDYFYDSTTVLLGDCHESVTGILHFGYGAFKINPYADGIVECAVAEDATSFGTLKALFR